MKKEYFSFVILVSIGIVVSGYVLCVVYATSVCQLFYEVSLAIFTGCLFAVPSGVVVLILDVTKNKRSIDTVLIDLNTKLEKLQNARYVFTDDAHRVFFKEELARLDRKIADLTYLNYPLMQNHIDTIRDELFTIRRVLSCSGYNMDSISDSTLSTTVKAATEKCFQAIDAVLKY